MRSDSLSGSIRLMEAVKIKLVKSLRDDTFALKYIRIDYVYSFKSMKIVNIAYVSSL